MTISTPPIATGTTPRKYTRRSETQWRELITNFEQSHLSLAAYCQQHSVAPSGFYSWRKRFDSTLADSKPSETLIDITAELNRPSAAARPGSSKWHVELELGHGCVLRIKTA